MRYKRKQKVDFMIISMRWRSPSKIHLRIIGINCCYSPKLLRCSPYYNFACNLSLGLYVIRIICIKKDQRQFIWNCNAFYSRTGLWDEKYIEFYWLVCAVILNAFSSERPRIGTGQMLNWAFRVSKCAIMRFSNDVIVINKSD